MAHFYGVYLRDKKLSGGLELIRYLLQPQDLRFCHLTLRGPYSHRMPEADLHSMNASVSSWSVLLHKPGAFFNDTQSTVFINVELNQIKKLVHKPDFPESVPHLTLYDGRDREVAECLLDVLRRYNWMMNASVSKMLPLARRQSTDGLYLECTEMFFDAFNEFVRPLGVKPRDMERLGRVDVFRLVEEIATKISSVKPFARRRGASVLFGA